MTMMYLTYTSPGTWTHRSPLHWFVLECTESQSFKHYHTVSFIIALMWSITFLWM